MLEKLKRVKWSLISASLLYLALGIALIVWPHASNLVLCYVAAGVLTVYGVFNILAYFGKERGSWFGLAAGVVCAAFGIFSLAQPTRISDIISILLGLAIVVDGALSLRRDLELRMGGFGRWWVPLLLDIVVLVVGVIVVFNPTLFAGLLLQVIGVVLIYESLSDLWTIHQLAALARTAQAIVDSQVVEGTVTDVEDAD